MDKNSVPIHTLTKGDFFIFPNDIEGKYYRNCYLKMSVPGCAMIGGEHLTHGKGSDSGKWAVLQPNYVISPDSAVIKVDKPRGIIAITGKRKRGRPKGSKNKRRI